MKDGLTGEVGVQSRLDHGLVGGYGDHRWGEGKVGTSQGEDLFDRRRHAAEHSFYLADTGQDHQSLDNMAASRIGLVEAPAFGSRRSHAAEAREGNPVEGSQVCDSL